MSSTQKPSGVVTATGTRTETLTMIAIGLLAVGLFALAGYSGIFDSYVKRMCENLGYSKTSSQSLGTSGFGGYTGYAGIPGGYGGYTGYTGGYFGTGGAYGTGGTGGYFDAGGQYPWWYSYVGGGTTGGFGSVSGGTATGGSGGEEGEPGWSGCPEGNWFCPNVVCPAGTTAKRTGYEPSGSVRASTCNSSSNVRGDTCYHYECVPNNTEDSATTCPVSACAGSTALTGESYTITLSDGVTQCTMYKCVTNDMVGEQPIYSGYTQKDCVWVGSNCFVGPAASQAQACKNAGGTRYNATTDTCTNLSGTTIVTDKEATCTDNGGTWKYNTCYYFDEEGNPAPNSIPGTSAEFNADYIRICEDMEGEIIDGKCQ